MTWAEAIERWQGFIVTLELAGKHNVAHNMRQWDLSYKDRQGWLPQTLVEHGQAVVNSNLGITSR